MAARFVGEAFLASTIGALVDMLVSPVLVNLIQRKKLNRKLVERLEATLKDAQVVINDAERRQIKENAVKEWLDILKDAVYKADDLLDEVCTKAATQKDPGNFFSRYLSSQDGEMVAKIEEIIDEPESIVKRKDKLRLKDIPVENMSWRIPSTSLVEMSDIYGRDEDRDAIVELLLDDTSDGRVSVIPIVGMGGIGKTTLAQLVYNDKRVKENFDFKAWVCIGEEFDVLKMTKTVLEAGAGTSSSCNSNDFDSIQLNLKNKLIGKKFLVVLDDVWNKNYDDWEKFQIPFQYGSEGSKILVTTREDAVASVVQTVPPYKLSLLSDEYCWLVFKKHACLSTKSPDFLALEKVGREIVKKCKGLPLAAQTLGGLLRTKNEVADWNYILKSEIWELSENDRRILPALRISYHYLPSHLKRCFVYCSLYPKDYNFDRDSLILLWMAEDLLSPPKSGSTLEESGYEYFNDLASRSFFQSSNTDERLFVMHDLMHDLATFYGGKFFFRTSELKNAATPNTETRHLSCALDNKDSVSKISEASDSLMHVRTLLQIGLDGFREFSKKTALCDLLGQLKCLRVLSFRAFDLDSLPDSIGELIHLRYLDLSDTYIVSLPESLHNLYNLQTLKLRNCKRLKMLPSGMQDLVNLRHLDIRDTNLEEMPEGMNKLKDLQFLSHYIVGKHQENGIRELGALASLHGALSIAKLKNVVDSGEALEAKMFDKKHINVLELKWSSDEDGDGDADVDSQTEREILDKLRPYTDLKELTIEGYRGTIFPDWLGRSSYHHMTRLWLRKCNNCCMLPSLGQLPSLKSLTLEYFEKLKIIGAEIYKDDETHQEVPFKSLKTLKFYYMPCWQAWHSFESDAFPRLEQLTIWKCPMLMESLPSHLPALKKLAISGCDQLACSLPRAPAILELQIDGKQEVRMQEQSLSLVCHLSISRTQLVASVFEAMTYAQPNCLRYLYISDCASAISFPGDCLPTSLQDLRIYDCHNLEFPMQQQQQLQRESLQEPAIHNSCDSLTSFPLAAFPNLRSLHITGCENMKSLEVSLSQSHDAAPLSLDELIISKCPSFVSLLSQSRNDALPSLSRLCIRSCPSFISLSALGLAAPQLQDLTVSSCPEIVSLTDGDEGLLPKLRTLSIVKCDKLVRWLASSTVLHSPGLMWLDIECGCESVESFPREGCLPASLKSLRLYGFPSLETLDCNGLLHLTSLEDLSIEYCPKLENMAGERLPASLMQLLVAKCPSLGERIKTKDPQIWPTISNIPRIYVNWRKIS